MFVAVIFELSYKLGKKQEHADRVCFSEKKSMEHIDTGCAA